jgi:glutamate N-acetyltransferase/amino-acid N-acetyltransferase
VPGRAGIRGWRTARAPLAPAGFPAIPALAGVRLAACAAGLRYHGRPDLTLIELAPGTTVAGVFTKSLLPGHPVRWCRAILPLGRARALVVKPGPAHVMIGPAGDAVVPREADATARLLGARPEEIYIASTGVIGERLDVETVVDRLPELQAALDPGAWEPAATAITTTDTFIKGSFAGTCIGETEVTIAGFAKGSGMIQPDMATMLAFLFTDARLPAGLLQALLAEANQGSFNAITVDGDTSTSDSVLLFATGQARHPEAARLDDPLLDGFRAALAQVTKDLALQVVRDGEGAQKLIEVRIAGAVSDTSARRIAFSIANSPLVKTAIAGGDANWGRLAMAIGKAGEPIEVERVAIRVGGHAIAEGGHRLMNYDEAPVVAHVKGQEVLLEVTVGAGPGSATVWTCDLTHGYISINADYRS